LLLTAVPQDFVIAGATGIQISIVMTDAQLGNDFSCRYLMKEMVCGLGQGENKKDRG
jgi:hypothetical protein